MGQRFGDILITLSSETKGGVIWVKELCLIVESKCLYFRPSQSSCETQKGDAGESPPIWRGGNEGREGNWPSTALVRKFVGVSSINIFWKNLNDLLAIPVILEQR